MSRYEDLPAPLREKVDEAAARTADLFGLTLDEARDVVLEHLLSRTVHPTHGTGH